MQRRGWDRAFRRVSREHPEWPLSSIKRAVNKFHAPYDQPAPPGHCTGAAVDVILLGPSGRPVDMTSPGKRWHTAATWHPGLTPAAKRNRMIMVEAMLGAGFSNCRDEYWHYSWGDSAWAVRTGETTCPYGWIDPPVSIETRFPGGTAGDIRKLDDNTWTVTADSAGNLLAGIFWSLGRPVTLHLESGVVFQISKDRKTWRNVETQVEGHRISVTVTPRYDRVYLKFQPTSLEGDDTTIFPDQLTLL
jgi:D-alanyl-D-alanine dipeptidase